MLMMYVHTHWSYRHPYAARTWTESDWHGYVRGVRALGFDAICFWPLLDSMPAEPTASDRAFLERAGRVIRFVREACGMRFLITCGPNAIGNDRARDFDFEDRPYFHCNRRINPGDPAAVREFLTARRRQLAPLGPTDGLIVIDSDPGGWPGSTTAEFVELAAAQADLMRELNPKALFLYWMWFGWEIYNRVYEKESGPSASDKPARATPLEVFVQTLERLSQRMSEPWGVTTSFPEHLEATERTGLGARRLFNPYGLIEGEPSFPLTNVSPEPIRDRLAEYTAARFPLGLMANAQTHAVQLPNTYLFAHFAQGGRESDVDLARFAGRLLPAAADVIARGWQAVATGDPDAQRAAAEALRPRVGRSSGMGDCAGLLFGDPDRFLTDLIHSLEIHAELTEFAATPTRERLRVLVPTVRAQQIRTGFNDAYYDDRLFACINQGVRQFDDPRIHDALANFRNWSNPIRHHGAIATLLDALEAFL